MKMAQWKGRNPTQYIIIDLHDSFICFNISLTALKTLFPGTPKICIVQCENILRHYSASKGS